MHDSYRKRNNRHLSAAARALLSWAAVICWAALIFYFSHQPNLATSWGIWDFMLRKMAHMAEFGMLTLLLWRAIKQHGPVGLSIMLASGLALLYAISDELHQGFVPGRSPALRDVGFDLTGILTVMVVVLWISRKRRPASR